jgi:hypothetical protein
VHTLKEEKDLVLNREEEELELHNWCELEKQEEKRSSWRQRFRVSRRRR